MAKFAKLVLKRTNENLGTEEGEGTNPDTPGIVSGVAAAEGVASAVADAAAGGVGVVPTSEPAVGGTEGQPGSATVATSTATPPVVGSEANPAAQVATAEPVPPAQGGAEVTPVVPAGEPAGGLTAPATDGTPVGDAAAEGATPAGVAVEPPAEPLAEPAAEPAPVPEVAPVGEPAAGTEPPAAEPAPEPAEVVGIGSVEGGEDTPLFTGSDEEIAEAADDEVVAVEDAAEAEAEAGEIGELNDGMDAAFDAVDRVEELKDVAADAIEKDGGLSETEAGIIEATHESVMSSLGMSHRNTKLSVNPVVTMEHYSSPRTKLSASMVTMEKLSDSVNQLKDHISDGWKKFIEMIKAALKRYIESTFTVKGIAEKKLQQLKSIDSSAMPTKPEVTGAAARGITVNGQASSQTATALLDAAAKMASLAVEGGRRLSTTYGQGAEASDAVVGEISKQMAGLPRSGGRTFSLDPSNIGGGADGKTSDSAKAPSRGEIESHLTKIIQVSDAIKRNYDEMVALADRLGSARASSEESTNDSNTRRSLTGLVNITGIAAAQNSNAVLAYCTAGMNNLKKPDTAKKDPVLDKFRK